MNEEGAVLGKVGLFPNDKSLSAIMSIVWQDYLEVGKEVLQQQDMPYVSVSTVQSRIFARKIRSNVLLIRSLKDVEVGLLRAKSDIISSLLESQMSKFEASFPKIAQSA